MSVTPIAGGLRVFGSTIPMEQRLDMFQEELALLGNEKARAFAILLLKALPNYFFCIPASSSGKYHPPQDLGEGGLVRHTKTAMQVFYAMANNAEMWSWAPTRLWGTTQCMTKEDFVDAGLLALLVHDGLKNGHVDGAGTADATTVHEHPLLAAGLVRTVAASAGIDKDVARTISEAVASHMGQWNVSKYSSVVLPTPAGNNWLCKMVHMADYIASRKFFNMDFAALKGV